MTKRSRATLKRVMGQPSWRLANGNVEAYVTRTGGHLGPVRFKLGRRKIEPLSVAPWFDEKLDRGTPPIIKVLRGDFFCMPFGGNATPFQRERYPVHGQTANADWQLKSLDSSRETTRLHLQLNTTIRRGRVDKRLELRKGHCAVYCQHVVSNMSGPMSFGHHAMVRFPDKPGSGAVSTSPFVYGQVFPDPVEKPEARGYSILQPGAEFSSLKSVAMITRQSTDVSRYPARRGFEDLLMICSDPKTSLAWTAVTFPRERYVWFALKDPRVLASTIFWISNGGRHYSPWNGRHVNVLGLEEVTSYFHLGLAESAGDNPISQRGIPTVAQLEPSTPLVVNYIIAVAEIPEGFDEVAAIEADPESQRVTLASHRGSMVAVPLDASFLGSGAPQ